MNYLYNFETHLIAGLNHAKNALRLLDIENELKFDDITIKISEEQNFAKMNKLTPDTVYVVIKYLSSDIQWYSKTTPIQLLVLSEQDSLERAKMILDKFTIDNNWEAIIDGTTYIKAQYSSPVVLNNYVEVSYGYRSVLYVSGTLSIMENIVDVKNVKIDNNEVKPLSFSLSYVMSTNTQAKSAEAIANSVKTVSTFSISMSIPMVDSDLVDKVMDILGEVKTGNDTFAVSFNCGIAISKNMKLTSAQIITAPNAVPSLNLGFMK